MTRHTDIVGKPWRKSSGIHDRRTCGFGGRPLAHLDNVSGAGTVTIFAADRQFIEWRNTKRSGDLRHRVRPAAVADDARSIDRPAERPVGILISRRQRPGARFGVVRQRGLGDLVASLDKPAHSVGARSDDPLYALRFAEHLFSVLIDR